MDSYAAFIWDVVELFQMVSKIVITSHKRPEILAQTLVLVLESHIKQANGYVQIDGKVRKLSKERSKWMVDAKFGVEVGLLRLVHNSSGPFLGRGSVEVECKAVGEEGAYLEWVRRWAGERFEFHV